MSLDWDRALIGIFFLIAAVLILLDISGSGMGTGMSAIVRVPLAIAAGFVGLIVAFPSLLGHSDLADRVRSLWWIFVLALIVAVIAASIFQ